MVLAVQLVLTVDKKVQAINPLPLSVLKEYGWEWFAGDGDWVYLAPEIVEVSRREILQYRRACHELYEMIMDAAQYVIDNNLWNELCIPPNLVEMIKMTWNDNRHLYLIGRFDVAGGMDGIPIKLIEFNADTPTILAETAFLQKELLEVNGIKPNQQFNMVYEELVDQFRKLKVLNSDLEPTLLVTTLGHEEDTINADVIFDAAEEAGFDVEYRDLEEISFSPDEGIFVEVSEDKFVKFDFLYKIVPWEFISLEEPELMDILNEIVRDRKAVIVNPAYSVLLQSKGLMKYLWDLNRNHDFLLETSFKKPVNPKNSYVEKVVYGREGENICIYDKHGEVIEETEGDFFEFPNIYQDFAKLPRDNSGNYYQPAIFHVSQPCALSFRRRNALIMDEDAKFVAHVLKD